MSIFDVKQSSQGTIALSTGPTTVDIGISSEGLGTLRRQHSGILVAAEGLASDQDIDRTINHFVGDLEELRSKAKQLLGSLKR